MFLALRDLRRSWSRFLLVGSVVALVAVLSTVLTGLANGLVQDGTSGLRALPLTNLAFQPGSQEVFSRSTLGSESLRVWKKVPGAEASPLGVSFANAAAAGPGKNVDLALFGIPADSYLVQRPDARQALTGKPGLVLASELEDEGIKVGDRFTFAGSKRALPVLGFTFAGSYGHVPIAFVSLAEWQTATYGSGTHDRFSAIALKLPSGTDTSSIDQRAGTETRSKQQSYNGSPGFTAETATMSLIRFFLLAISALIVGAFFTVLTIQRTPQIGLLKAMGASTAYVLKDGLGQIVIVVAVATVVGTALGAALTLAISGGAVPIHLSMSSVLLNSALLATASIVGSLVAFRRVIRIQPAIALAVSAN